MELILSYAASSRCLIFAHITLTQGCRIFNQLLMLWHGRKGILIDRGCSHGGRLHLWLLNVISSELIDTSWHLRYWLVLVVSLDYHTTAVISMIVSLVLFNNWTFSKCMSTMTFIFHLFDLFRWGARIVLHLARVWACGNRIDSEDCGSVNTCARIIVILR